MPGTAGLQAHKVVSQDFTIASGTTSAEIDLKGGTLAGLRCPSGIASSSVKVTSTNAASGTYIEDLEDGLTTDKSYSIVASKRRLFKPSDVAGLRFIKFVFSSTETAKTFTVDYRSIE
jgi:hypothetical protein